MTANKVFLGLLLLTAASPAPAAESIWFEAEHLDGIRGYCWPMGPPAIKKTAGHWALSGPGWAAEWSQGGESGFLSIATAADDDKAAASTTLEIPEADRYSVWVRYGDWREQPEPFEIVVEQPGTPAWTGEFGRQPVIDEDNEMKLYWGWAFGWAKRDVTLKKGPAKLTLRTSLKAAEPRQIDAIVLSSDTDYRPRIKERPHADVVDVLESYRTARPTDLEPLARTRGRFDLPEAWKLHTFHDKGFVYLWNINSGTAPETWLSDKPERVRVPYQIADERVRKDFEQKYAGKDNPPIFSDPRLVPTFHGVGPAVFATDPQTGELLEPGKRFAKWLDEHPGRPWGMMMNYAPATKIGQQGIDAFLKYRDRYVGSVAGESLGYFSVDPQVMQAAVAPAQTRRQLVEAFTPPSLAANSAIYRTVYGKDLDPNPFAEVISCLSIDNIAFAPIAADWGARTIGYESSAMTSSLLPMRWAFMRGTARQRGTLTCTYRSCNFGDASTIFSDASSFSSPKNILDNYYSVFSGAGMTWYKFDIWYQYMAGSSMFYHEQGFDEYWKPGGTTVAGEKEVQLSPKGKLVDRFLRVTAAQPDRGSPFTPVAFLVDYAHGWEPSPFWPNSFNNYHGQPERFRPGDHERMLSEYFWTAYHPIGLESQKPITGTSEVNVPGVFGDIFDVVFAYPDVNKWRTLDTYPVVIVAGEIELTAAEGQRLADYVAKGGTLLVADAHLTGPGLAALQLPAVGAPAEAAGYRWLSDPKLQPSQRYRYKPITVGANRSLAETSDGASICTASDRGQGRLIYLSLPHGLGIDRRATPIVPRLMAHLTRGLMPVEVDGDVEWMVNRTARGWSVTLLNPAGQDKPQQGMTPTDYRQNRPVTIHVHVPVKVARDLLLADEPLAVEKNGAEKNGAEKNSVRCQVLAGGVRIVELE